MGRNLLSPHPLPPPAIEEFGTIVLLIYDGSGLLRGLSLTSFLDRKKRQGDLNYE